MFKRHIKLGTYRATIVLVLITVMLTAWGGTPPGTPSLSLDFGIKQLQFSWPAVTGADFYRLFENPDGVSGFTQAGPDFTATRTTRDIAVHFQNWANARYLVEACNAAGCTASNEVATLGQVLNAVREDSSATSINGNASDNSAVDSGSVYLY